MRRGEERRGGVTRGTVSPERGPNTAGWLGTYRNSANISVEFNISCYNCAPTLLGPPGTLPSWDPTRLGTLGHSCSPPPLRPWPLVGPVWALLGPSWALLAPCWAL